MNRRILRPLPLALTLILAGLAATPASAQCQIPGGFTSGKGSIWFPSGSGDYACGDYSVQIGGQFNSASGQYSVSLGGYYGGGVGAYATAVGGNGSVASGDYSSVFGGLANGAVGNYAVVPGGYNNIAGGDNSFAAGYGAQVRYSALGGGPNGDHGTFMWADDTPNVLFRSTGPQQFLIRANGGFALNTTPVNQWVSMTVAATASNPGYASIFLVQGNSDNGILVSSGDASTGAQSSANDASFYVDQYNGSGHTRRLALDKVGNMTVTAQAYKPGGGSWAASSDARLKTNVQPLANSLERLLALRGVTFEYSQPDAAMHPSGTRMGFIAQEVEPLFPTWIGHDSEGYLTVGPQGFEALTVEAFRQLKASGEARLDGLEEKNMELTRENQDLRAQVAALNAKLAAEIASLRRDLTALAGADTRAK